MSEAEVSIPETTEGNISRRKFLGIGLGLFGAGLASKAIIKGAEALGNSFSKGEGSQEIDEAELILGENKLPSDYNYDFRFPLTEKFSGADSCTSVKKGDKIYTFYSDTFQGGTQPQDEKGKSARPDDWNGTMMVNNSLIIWDTEKETYTVATRKTTEGFNTAWIRPRYDEAEERRIEDMHHANSFYWMQPPIIASSGDKMYMLMSRMVNNPEKDNSIAGTFIGNDLITYNVSDEASPLPQAEPIIPLPRVNTEKRETSWGAGIVTMKDQTDGKTYNYIYASSKDLKHNPWHKKDLRVARVEESHMTNLSKWQFWKGDQWAEVDINIQHRYNQEKNDEEFKPIFDQAFKEAEAQAIPIIEREEGGSSGFSVNAIDGNVVIINKHSDLIGPTIDVIKGKSPTGPFKIEPLIDVSKQNGKIQKTKTGKEFQEVNYLAYLHPEVIHPTTGKMPITLCSNVIGEGAAEAHKSNSEFSMVKTFWVTKEELLNTEEETDH